MPDNRQSSNSSAEPVGRHSAFSVLASTLIGLDIDEQAIATFGLNHPRAAAIRDSVENVTGGQLLDAAKMDSVDVLIGGPSCQGYSTIGPRLKDDPRNLLFAHYLRLVAELRPRWIVFENVKGMKFHGGGKFFSQLCRELADLGYSIASDVLNAADYGVPQRRERLIVARNQGQREVALPPPTHEDPRCLVCSRPDGPIDSVAGAAATYSLLTSVPDAMARAENRSTPLTRALG